MRSESPNCCISVPVTLTIPPTVLDSCILIRVMVEQTRLSSQVSGEEHSLDMAFEVEALRVSDA